MEIEDIAIAGVSGRFPNADNLEEFKQALLNGLDLITDDHKRWPYLSLKTPGSMGIVNDFENFDATFFEINPKAAALHDPRGRKLLEVVFESIVDAGLNPSELKGSKTGVFLGIMQNSLDYDYLRPGSGINSSTYIIANNISYIFDLHGPSCGVDTGCSSSLYAFNQAVDSMLLGVCDAAIVCSAHANFLPHDSVEFAKLGVLNPDGRCKTFDDDRKGYVKSESVVSILLQRKHTARRIYATVRAIGCNVDGYKEDGLLHPSSRMQLSLLRDVYQRYNINPNEVAYVECHGTGTLVGDIEECEGLAEFFSYHERSAPLQIGSVKTNVGHTEAAGGLVSLVKLLITIQSGVIPANLHFITPACDISSVYKGKLKVISQNTRYEGGLLAVNSFGLGGANGHLVIEPYLKVQQKNAQDNLKFFRLILVSGRTEDAVENILHKINENSDNANFLTLIDDIFATDIKNHSYRGYSILNGSKEFISRLPSRKRPIWFSYSGMGSQWPKMARDLVHFDVFRETLKECAQSVQTYGINLEDIVLNGTAETFNDPVNCFTSIIAVSIGLTKLLFSMGIKPDGIIGHSLGEIGCAYCDGLLTVQQAILVAFARGWATKNTQLVPGLMASVGLSVEECEELLPHDVFVACDNSLNNVTVSGPEESIRTFSHELSNKGIFVRIVNTANIAFHSKYVSDVGPKFLEFLKTIEIQPKMRRKWLPSAVSECEWDSDLGKYNSVDYQCYNFLNRVLYNQVLKKIPKDAILIEVAPCGLFQAIFRRALNVSITKLYLVEKFGENREFLLESVGKLYLAGAQPKLRSLYEKVEYPLGADVPMISPLIKWNHAVKWSLPQYDSARFFGKKVHISMMSRENKFLLEHVVAGRNLFPVSGYIILVWQTFSNMMEIEFDRTPIIIEEFKLMRSQFISKNDSIVLTINILKSGVFEVSDKEGILATGKIREANVVEDVVKQLPDLLKSKEKYVDIKLNTEDVYKMLCVRGYEYRGQFKSIIEVDYNQRTALVKWNKNWITLLDSMFQSVTLIENSELVLPTGIYKISINPIILNQILKKGQVPLKYNYLQKSVGCNGVNIQNLTWSKVPIKKREENVFRSMYKFVPNVSKVVYDQEKREYALQNVLQIVLENNITNVTVEIMEMLQTDSVVYKDLVRKLLHPNHLKRLKYHVSKLMSLASNIKYDLILIPTLEINEKTYQLFETLDENTFIYIENFKNLHSDFLTKFNFLTIFERKSHKHSYILLKKSKRFEENYNIIRASESHSSWMEIVKTTERCNSEVVGKLVVGNFNAGILNILDCCKGQINANNLRIFSINDKDMEFKLDSPFYQQQLKKGLIVNVLENNEWGTYRYLSVEQYRVDVNSCCMSFVNNEFQWVQENPYLFKDNKVNVHYSSLDFWDHPLTKSKVNETCLGVDYSGVTDSGVEVIGLSDSGTLRTHLNFHENFTWTVPKGWSLKDAASIPFAYTMSCYGLFIKGNLKRHHTILTMYNATTIDLAAINIISNVGCTFFVGVSSQKYIKLLTSLFPKLRSSIVDITCSRDQEKIMKRTLNQGVDIMFNCENHDVFRYTIGILKHKGKVICINTTKKTVSSDISDTLLVKKCTIHDLTLDSLLKENYYVRENIRNVIQTYLDKNIIKPFYADVINMTKIGKFLKNFRTTSNGKIMVKICGRHQAQKMDKKFVAYPRTYLDPDKSYIIISNFDITDMVIVNWLNVRGAKKIVVNSYNDNISGYATFYLENLRKTGGTVITSSFDITSSSGAQDLTDLATNLGCIGGIFYISNDIMNERTEINIMELKCDIVKNLDIVSRKACKSLDYFVVFLYSDPHACGKNTSKYNYTQATIESICDNRRKNNLPALAIRWESIANYTSPSYLKESKENSSQSIYSCLETLDMFMQLDTAVCSSVVCGIAEDSDESASTTIIESVAKIFGVRCVDKIDSTTRFANLGMDSIMGFELKTLLYSHFGVNYSVNDIRKLSLESITQLEETRKSVANNQM